MSTLDAATPLVEEFQLPGVSEGRAHSVARVCALVVAALATVALLGWVIDVETLRSMVRGRVSMNPITAIAFGLCALSLWLVIATPAGKGWRIRPAAQALALAVIGIGAIRDVGYFLHWEGGIDQILFAGKLGNNRMAPNTAINFIVIGLALVSVDMRSRAGRRAAVWLTIMAAFIAMLGISGYIYRVISLSGMTSCGIPERCRNRSSTWIESPLGNPGSQREIESRRRIFDGVQRVDAHRLGRVGNDRLRILRRRRPEERREQRREHNDDTCLDHDGLLKTSRF